MNNLKSKSLKVNVLLNCLKTAMNIIFPLITFPYISRVLGPIGIGKINFGNSIVSYFSLLGTLGIVTYGTREGAVVRENQEKRDYFFNELFTVNFFSSICASIILIIIINIVPQFRNYRLLIFIQSLIIFCNWISVEWIYSIYEDYLQITIRTLITQLVSIILMFLFVKTTEDYHIYAGITIISAGGICIFNYMSSKRYYRPHIYINKNVFRHLTPMVVLTVNLLAITIYVNSDITMIGIFMNDEDVGIYSIGVKVYTIVKNLLSAIVVTITPRVSSYYLNGKFDEYKRLVNKVKKIFILLLVPAMVGLFMMSNEIIFVLAGENYSGSAVVLKILSVTLLFSVFGTFISSVDLIVRRLEKKVLIVTIISACINMGLNLYFIHSIGIVGAAITTFISELFVFIAFLFISNIEKFNKSDLRTIISALIVCVGIVIICIAMKYLIKNAFIRLFFCIVICIAFMGIIYVLRKESKLLLSRK